MLPRIHVLSNNFLNAINSCICYGTIQFYFSEVKKLAAVGTRQLHEIPKEWYWKLPCGGASSALYRHEERPSEKKANCKLRGTTCSYTVISYPENGNLMLLHAHFGDAIP
jgi:hypothetical protein